jgi:predicted methyltransferase
MKASLLAATTLALALAAPVAAKGPSPAIVAAVADPARPQADRDRDAARQPAKVLELLGVKPGQKVADFVMGGGYWTRMLAKAVGPSGKVYAYQPGEFLKFGNYAKTKEELAAAYPNVVASSEPFAGVSFPEKLDAIITVQNWHDLHVDKIAPAGTGAAVAKALYDSLKPGGILLVVDHGGLNTAGPFADAPTLHRGDAAATQKELEAAGFKLAGTSGLYANRADPKTANVFDKAIRGHTDQFVQKYRRP